MGPFRPLRPALLINLWGWVWGSELLRFYIKLHYVVIFSGDTVGWSWCRCELNILCSINIQGLNTSSYNLFILSRTKSSLVIRLKTLYAYACNMITLIVYILIYKKTKNKYRYMIFTY